HRRLAVAGGDAALLPAPGDGPGRDGLDRRRLQRPAGLDLAAVDDLDHRVPVRGGGGVAGAVVLGRDGRHRLAVPRHPHGLRAGPRGPGRPRALVRKGTPWISTEGWRSSPAATGASGGPSPSRWPRAAPTSPSSTA